MPRTPMSDYNKTTKSSRRKREYGTVKKAIVHYDEYFSWKERPVSDTFLNALASRLMDWADRNDHENDKESLHLADFYSEVKVFPGTFHLWLKRHEPLQEAFEYAKTKIGVRRERGAMKRRYDGAFVKGSLPYYLPEYKEMLEWQAKLKSMEDTVQGILTAVLSPKITDEEVQEANSKIDNKVDIVHNE